MKIQFGIALLFSVMLAVSCNPVKIYLEKNEVADAEEYETFYVINQYYDKDAFDSPVLEENLQHRLTEGLKEIGFEQDEIKPDLIVRYNTNLTDRQKEVTSNSMSPYGWGMYNPWMMGGPWGNNGGYRIEKYDMGELVVDIIDTKQDKVVMRISAMGEINKPAQKSKNLNTSVEKILKEFSKRIATQQKS